MIVIVGLVIASAAAGAFFLAGGTYVVLRSAFVLGVVLGSGLLLSLYCGHYLREGKGLLVLLSFLAYFSLLLLWVLFIVRLFGLDNLLQVDDLTGGVQRGHGRIGREDLAVWGRFRVGNMLNYFYFAAPGAALLGVLFFRNAWWFKAGAVAVALVLSYIAVTFAARGPILIAFATGGLFFFLLLRRHLGLALISCIVFSVGGFLAVRLVDPLLLQNLLLRFETIGQDGRILLITMGVKALFQGPFSAAGSFLDGYYAHNLIIDYGLQFNILVSLALLALLFYNAFVSLRWCLAFFQGQADRFVLVPLAMNLGTVLTVMIQPNSYQVAGMWVLSLGLLVLLWEARSHPAAIRAPAGQGLSSLRRPAPKFGYPPPLRPSSPIPAIGMRRSPPRRL